MLREPLLQFLLLGAVLFGLFGLFGKKNEAEAPAKIVISAARIATLADGFARTLQRPPTDEELRGLVDDHIREEVFYREGRAAGLDRDDALIRRRVRQKMEFLAEDVAAADPSDEQLASFLASHPERFKTAGRLTFRHVFLSETRRGSAMESDAKRLAHQFAHTAATERVVEVGDPFLLGEEFRSISETEVANTFGASFAKQIAAVEIGRWRGPFPSGFGLHFVFVDKRTPASLPPLDAVRQAVHKEWLNERRLESEKAFYRKLRDRYEIIIEPAKAAGSGARQ